MPLYTPQEHKRFFIVAISAYIAFLLLSIWFYQERTLFSDISFHLFHIMKDGDYAIQNERFGAFITQSIPLIGSYLGLSLKKIAFLYSIGFVLYYFGIFLLLWLLLKNRVLALVLLLMNTIMVGGTFFWIQSEFPQGLAFMLLLFGILTHHPSWRDYAKIELLLIPPMLVTVAYFHPLIFIPFTYICAFLWFSQKEFPIDRKLLSFSFGFFWLIYILKKTIFAIDSDYESAAVSGLGNFLKSFPNYLFTTGNTNFILYIATAALTLLFFGMLYLYKQQKRWILLLLLLGFFISYLILVSVSYNFSTFQQFYFENLYLPLSIMVAFPFIIHGLPRLQSSWKVAVLAFFVCACLTRIIAYSAPYSKRLAWQKDFLYSTEKFANKKLFVHTSKIPKDVLMDVYWSTPYEFWLLSSIKNGSSSNSRSIIIYDDLKQLKDANNSNDHFVTYWGSHDYAALPMPYFNMNDSSSYVYYNPNGQ